MVNFIIRAQIDEERGKQQKLVTSAKWKSYFKNKLLAVSLCWLLKPVSILTELSINNGIPS